MHQRHEQVQLRFFPEILPLIGVGGVLPDDDDKYAEYVTLRSGSGLTEHTMIYGATGSGKTRPAVLQLGDIGRELKHGPALPSSARGRPAMGRLKAPVGRRRTAGSRRRTAKWTGTRW